VISLATIVTIYNIHANARIYLCSNYTTTYLTQYPNIYRYLQIFIDKNWDETNRCLDLRERAPKLSQTQGLPASFSCQTKVTVNVAGRRRKRNSVRVLLLLLFALSSLPSLAVPPRRRTHARYRFALVAWSI